MKQNVHTNSFSVSNYMFMFKVDKLGLYQKLWRCEINMSINKICCGDPLHYPQKFANLRLRMAIANYIEEQELK